MKEGGICPRCGWGHMYFRGKRGTDSNVAKTTSGLMTGLECDNCGYRHAAYVKGFVENVAVSPGLVSATVTKGKTKKKTQKKTQKNTQKKTKK